MVYVAYLFCITKYFIVVGFFFLFIVDAAYEGMMKRTFLAMIIMILAHLPFLLFFACMYSKLGRPSKDFHSEDESESSDDNDNNM